MSDNNEGFEEIFNNARLTIDDGDPLKYFLFAWNHLTEKHNKKINEWKMECDGLMSNCMANHADLDIKCQTLEAQLEVLTKCNLKYGTPCIENYIESVYCQGCKNAKKLKEGVKGNA